MKTLLNALFGRHRSPASNAAHASKQDNPLTIADGSENAIRRQLVQVLLRDVFRKSGIPPAWIECRMLVVSSRSKGSGMFVRLVVKHWDSRLLDYAFAFQTTLMGDIKRFDSNASWLHGISWELEPDNTCPYLTLPDKSHWQGPGDAVDPGRDLASRLAVHRQTFNHQAVEGLHSASYEKNEPRSL